MRARRCGDNVRLAIFALLVLCVACGGGGGTSTSPAAVVPAVSTATATPGAASTPSVNVQSTPTPLPAGTARSAFAGAFFRAQGVPPFGVFSVLSPNSAPSPYPTPGTSLLGPAGYCTRIAANGVSIETGNLVDSVKLNNIVALGVRWVRMAAPQFFDDLTHVFGPGHVQFADFDSAQCSTLAEHNIEPVIGLEAGPLQVSSVIGTLPAGQLALYATATDFGSWCGAVATHEKTTFPNVKRYSLPGNEVNTNPQLFPGGAPQIAEYSKACYKAIKAANPNAFVYGFELNMDGLADAPGFVRQMLALGCKAGTCYDGLAIHLSLRYPVPPASTPCYPNAGGDYSLQCITDIQTAAQAPVRLLVSETVYPVPGFVPDEATKAKAVVADFTALATNAFVDGVSYANVDECGLYPSGFFAGGCLVSMGGQQLLAYTALAQLAGALYQ